MRKLIITIITVLCFFEIKAQFSCDFLKIDEAKIIVTYELTYVEDTTNPGCQNKEEMLLLIGDSLSCFMSSGKYHSDKMWKNGEWQEMITKGVVSAPANAMSSFQYYIIKNPKQSAITVFDAVFMTGSFEYEEKTDIFNWQTSTENAVYQDFTIQKAMVEFGGRKWIAWFAPDLPISDGPYKFCGLPGLILKISDTRNHYIFNMISIEKPAEKMPIEITDKVRTKTTKKIFFKVEDDCRENILGNAKSAVNSSSDLQKIAKSMNSKNNPIELDRK